MAKYNDRVQDYKGIKLRLIVYDRKTYAKMHAKRFTVYDNSWMDEFDSEYEPIAWMPMLEPYKPE